MLSNKTFLTTLLSCFILTTGCATQDGESDDADLEFTFGGDGKADGLEEKSLTVTIGEEHFGAAGETTSAEASVRFNAADKLAVRADITVFTTMSVWDESTQSHLKDYIVTFEAQADDPNVTLGFGLMQEDHPPITVDGSKLFEHVALDFGAKEMTINRDTTVKFEDLDIELPEYFEWTSVAVIAVPLATSDGSEFKGTYTYDLVTTVLR